MMTITTTTSGGFNQTIAFEVAGCSGFSSNYRPEHILQDCPTDQASRWSSATNDAHQYILLKISVPALLDTITFGKFHKGKFVNRKPICSSCLQSKGICRSPWSHTGKPCDGSAQRYPTATKNPHM